MNVFALFALSILIISTTNALQCQNGGNDLSGVCVCPSGYIGDKCQSIKCAHGDRISPYKCSCDCGWTGKFCNITKQSVCGQGELAARGNCVCYPNWEGARCDELVCREGRNAAIDIINLECTCKYSGRYPHCSNNEFPKEADCGHGEITALGVCVCHSNWKGARCDTFYCEGSNAVTDMMSWKCRCKYSGTYPDCNNKFPTTKVVLWSSVCVVGVILLVIGLCWCSNSNSFQCVCDCPDDEESQQGAPPLNSPPPSYTQAVAK